MARQISLKTALKRIDYLDDINRTQQGTILKLQDELAVSAQAQIDIATALEATMKLDKVKDQRLIELGRQYDISHEIRVSQSEQIVGLANQLMDAKNDVRLWTKTAGDHNDRIREQKQEIRDLQEALDRSHGQHNKKQLTLDVVSAVMAEKVSNLEQDLEAQAEQLTNAFKAY